MTKSEFPHINSPSTKRLDVTRAKTPILEAENTELKAQITKFETKIKVLETENAILKDRLHEIETDRYIIEHICSKCNLLRGKVVSDQTTYGDKQFGHIRRLFECENCHNEYEKQH